MFRLSSFRRGLPRLQSLVSFVAHLVSFAGWRLYITEAVARFPLQSSMSAARRCSCSSSSRRYSRSCTQDRHSHSRCCWSGGGHGSGIVYLLATKLQNFADIRKFMPYFNNIDSPTARKRRGSSLPLVGSPSVAFSQNALSAFRYSSSNTHAPLKASRTP